MSTRRKLDFGSDPIKPDFGLVRRKLDFGNILVGNTEGCPFCENEDVRNICHNNHFCCETCYDKLFTMTVNVSSQMGFAADVVDQHISASCPYCRCDLL